VLSSILQYQSAPCSPLVTHQEADPIPAGYAGGQQYPKKGPKPFQDLPRRDSLFLAHWSTIHHRLSKAGNSGCSIPGHDASPFQEESV